MGEQWDERDEKRIVQKRFSELGKTAGESDYHPPIYSISAFYIRGRPHTLHVYTNIDAAGCDHTKTHTHTYARAYNTLAFNAVIGCLAAAMCVSQ